MDLCEFKANMAYKESAKTAKAVTPRNPVSETNKQKALLIHSNFISIVKVQPIFCILTSILLHHLLSESMPLSPQHTLAATTMPNKGAL